MAKPGICGRPIIMKPTISNHSFVGDRRKVKLSQVKRTGAVAISHTGGTCAPPSARIATALPHWPHWQLAGWLAAAACYSTCATRS